MEGEVAEGGDEDEDEEEEKEDGEEEDGWAAVSWGWYAPRTSLMPMP